MTHEEFVHAYREGRIEVRVDGKAAARLMSQRLLLPLLLLPVFGLAVAAALLGHLYAGIVIFCAGAALRFGVRATSRGFVLARSLSDPAFFRAALDARALTILPG